MDQQATQSPLQAQIMMGPPDQQEGSATRSSRSPSKETRSKTQRGSKPANTTNSALPQPYAPYVHNPGPGHAYPYLPHFPLSYSAPPPGLDARPSNTDGSNPIGDVERMGFELNHIISQLQADQVKLSELLHRRGHHQMIIDVNQSAVAAIDEQVAPIRDRLAKAASLFPSDNANLLTGGSEMQYAVQPTMDTKPGKPSQSKGQKSGDSSLQKTTKSIRATNNPAAMQSLQHVFRFGPPDATHDQPNQDKAGPASKKRHRESVPKVVPETLLEETEAEAVESKQKKKRPTAIAFTGEDKEDMIKWLTEAGSYGKTTAGFWAPFAELHPRHSALSWAIYYKRHRQEIEPHVPPGENDDDSPVDAVAMAQALEDEADAELQPLVNLGLGPSLLPATLFSGDGTEGAI